MRLGAFVLSSVVSLVSSAAFAQAPAATAQGPAPRGATVGFMHAIHATNNLETTAAFYKEVFGLSSPIRPFAPDGPRVLTNSPNANLRVSMLPIPGQGFNFELTEFTSVEPRTTGQQPGVADPGAPHMKFFVRDLAPVMAGVAKMGHQIITTGGRPVTVNGAAGQAQVVVFRDPDGYIVEAIQLAAPADAPASNVVGSMMGLTVRDMDADMKFWRDRMGWDLTVDKGFSSDQAVIDVWGLPRGSSYRSATGVVPGSKARIQLVEFKGVPRREFSLRVTDPGASGMAIRVQKIDELLTQLKSDGIRVLSKDQKLVEWSATLRNVFLKEPNGLNLELVGTVPGAPATPPAGAGAAQSGAAAPR
jgi:catechol 2,3-dioxygenase-like lactoylglutathione lyase family enzyme